LFDLLASLLLLVVIYPFIFIYSKITGNKESKVVPKLLLLPKVFTGKYSLVGVPIWYDDYDYEFLGKKGLTGMIQLYNSGITKKEDENNYLIYYAKNQSIQFDIEILLKTFITIIKK
jgi:lipopolysaccharide/colanic/teichoic acid biosynthesis glycosyltransferase